MTHRLTQLMDACQGAHSHAIEASIALAGLWDECMALGLIVRDEHEIPLITLTEKGREAFHAL